MNKPEPVTPSAPAPDETGWHLRGAAHLEQLERHARELGDRLRSGLPAVRFPRQVGWASSYDGVLRNDFEEVTSSTAVLEATRDTGRVLLTGRGGSGKTIVLRSLYVDALERGMLPFYVDLSRWTGPDYAEWDATGGDDSRRISFLLGRFGQPRTTAAQLDAIPPTRQKLFLVDGLSEITAAAGAGVLAAFDALARDVIQASVIVADRMVRREFRNPARWQLGTLLPLSVEDVTTIVERETGRSAPDRHSPEMALLRTPFFLDERLRTGEVAATGSAALREFFTRHAGLSSEDLDRAAYAAFQVYGTGAARSFSLEEFRKLVGPEVVTKLTQAGILMPSDGVAAFGHHLEHDYLVSRYIAGKSDTWSARTFEVVSLRATSFDTIALALEQLQQDAADDFLRRVYDWNVYAPAYAMAEGKRRQSLQVSYEMELVMLAMLAEKRWDILSSSAERASDALGVYPTDLALKFLDAENLSEVIAVVDAHEHPTPWFEEWRALFSRPVGATAKDPDVEALGTSVSIIGWTAANVLKRLSVSDAQQGKIRDLAVHGDETVRWRAAHVLGAFPVGANVDCLWELWDSVEPGNWIRYGATRSLVESAARGQAEVRAGIFEGFATRAPRMLEDGRSLEEFTRAVILRHGAQPSDWTRNVGRVLQSLFRLSDAPEEQERWRYLDQRLSAKNTEF